MPLPDGYEEKVTRIMLEAASVKAERLLRFGSAEWEDFDCALAFLLADTFPNVDPNSEEGNKIKAMALNISALTVAKLRQG